MESGVVNLKAELYKKRSTINGNSVQIEPKTTKYLKLKGFDSTKVVSNKTKKLKIKKSEIQTEENSKIEKSRIALEKKAQLYEKLKCGVEVLEDDDLNQRFLINFQKKITEDVNNKKCQKISNETFEVVTDAVYPAKYKEDEWISYTDAFGRSRVCLRQDLPSSAKQDSVVADEAKERMAAHHQRWTRIDEEAQCKDNIHYEDVLYNEAREHGVSFMPFSRDTTERNAQHELLRKLREETKTSISSNKVETDKKKKAMALRLTKVRQRKRLKAGLPMLDIEDERLKTPPTSEDEEAVITEEVVPAAVETSSQEKATPKVREWDLGKPGTSQLLTQEKWVESRRIIREDEFAPPPIYAGSSSRTCKITGFVPASDGDSYNKQSATKYQHEYNEMQWKKSESSQDLDESKADKCKNQDFAPPSTFEYYGPTNRNYKNKVRNDSLGRAISKGLSNLRKGAS